MLGLGLISLVILWSAAVVVVIEGKINVCQTSGLELRVKEETILKLTATYETLPDLTMGTITMDDWDPRYTFCSFAVYAKRPNYQDVCSVECTLNRNNEVTDIVVEKCEIQGYPRNQRRTNDHHPNGHHATLDANDRQRRRSTGQLQSPAQDATGNQYNRPRYHSDPTPNPRPPLPPRPPIAPPLPQRPPTSNGQWWQTGYPTGSPMANPRQLHHQRPQRPVPLHQVDTGRNAYGDVTGGGANRRGQPRDRRATYPQPNSPTRQQPNGRKIQQSGWRNWRQWWPL